ncbi:MAG: deoxyribodipyrimidine photo-lyase, partial [Planctomycetota bacterium]
MRPLVWFRTDLRVSDNTALHEAAAAAKRGVVAVFVVCAQQWRDEHDWGPMKADFMLRNVAQLSESLSKRNIALRMVRCKTFDDVPKALVKLAKAEECDALYFNDEHELNERRRDEATEDAFDSAGIDVHRFNDATIFEPGSVLTGDGRTYTVYSPFKKRWKAQWQDGDERPVLATPKKQAEMIGKPDDVPSVDELKAFDTSREHATRPDLWKAGESVASGLLGAFVQHRIDDYKADRDYPWKPGTSGLSPYLAAGVLSPRQCLSAAMDANNGKLDAGSEGAVGFIDEILWREFYHHLTARVDRLSMGRNFRPEYDDLDWDEDDDRLEAWQNGQTGYPIVDAAMRCLNATGWMHNRLRMVVSMFLTKHLFLHWRHGERYFCNKLVDLDYCSNNGGWQWSASTGTDAQPYFRIFNP